MDCRLAAGIEVDAVRVVVDIVKREDPSECLDHRGMSPDLQA